jgi:hypothetical protein
VRRVVDEHCIMFIIRSASQFYVKVLTANLIHDGEVESFNRFSSFRAISFGNVKCDSLLAKKVMQHFHVVVFGSVVLQIN